MTKSEAAASRASSSASSAHSSSVSSSTSYAATAAAYAHSLHSQRSRSLPAVTSIKHFPTISITAEEQMHYDRVVGRLLYRTVQEYANCRGEVDRKQWTPVRKNHNMTIYRSVKNAEDPLLSLMLGVGKIDGSLEDVMDGLYADNTTDLRCVKAFLKSKVIAGTVLQVSEKRTPDDPFNFAGIKWFAAKTPGGPVSYDRDLLTYERQGMTLDADGNEVAYHLLQSVDRPEWPANTFKSLIRAHCSTCYLYKRTDSGVESFFLGEFYASGSFPQRISDYGIAGKWLSVVNAVKCSEARKLTQFKKRSRSRRLIDASVAMCETNVCHACKGRRSAQVLCAGCLQNVCKSCSEEKKLFKLDSADRPRIDHFCKECIALAARQRGSKIFWDGVSAEQPPAYFEHVFHFTDSSATTVIAEDSVADMSFLNSSRSFFDSATSNISLNVYRNSTGSNDDLGESRGNPHLSNRSYTHEQLMADLFSPV